MRLLHPQAYVIATISDSQVSLSKFCASFPLKKNNLEKRFMNHFQFELSSPLQPSANCDEVANISRQSFSCERHKEKSRFLQSKPSYKKNQPTLKGWSRSS